MSSLLPLPLQLLPLPLHLLLELLELHLLQLLRLLQELLLHRWRRERQLRCWRRRLCRPLRRPLRRLERVHLPRLKSVTDVRPPHAVLVGAQPAEVRAEREHLQRHALRRQHL